MANPGPKPKPKHELRSVTIGVRVKPGLRDQLQEVAKSKSKENEEVWTLGEECAERLRESFDNDKPIRERFGSLTAYWLFRVLAEQIGVIEHQAGVISFDEQTQEYRPGEAWLKNRFAFDQVRAMINTVLDYLAPSGKPKIPSNILRAPLFDETWARSLGRQAAINAIAALEAAVRSGGNHKAMPGFVDSFAAGRRIQPKLQRSALETIENKWPAERERIESKLERIHKRSGQRRTK